MNIKVLCLFLPLFGVVLIFCSGCGTIVGKSVNSEISPDFNIKDLQRYHSRFINDGFDISTVIDVFEEERLVPYNGQGGIKDIEVYVDAESGFCLPPRFNPRIMSLQFTFPRKASVKVEDAITKKVLLEVNYKRALFAIGAGYEECRNMIIEALKKALVESKKNPTNPSKQ